MTTVRIEHRSQRHDWKTPTWLIESIHEVFGEITYDMCTSSDNPTRAKNWVSPTHEQKFGSDMNRVLWCNPPYGRQLLKWVIEWTKQPFYDVSLLLIPARTDTRAFRCAMHASTSVYFFGKRLHFDDAEDPAPFPSALFIQASVERTQQLVDKLTVEGDGGILMERYK